MQRGAPRIRRVRVGAVLNQPRRERELAVQHRQDQRRCANGGQILNGPMEVPGGDWIAQGIDPQGALFAVHSSKPAATKAPAAAKTTTAAASSKSARKAKPSKARPAAARAGSRKAASRKVAGRKAASRKAVSRKAASRKVVGRKAASRLA